MVISHLFGSTCCSKSFGKVWLSGSIDQHTRPRLRLQSTSPCHVATQDLGEWADGLFERGNIPRKGGVLFLLGLLCIFDAFPAFFGLESNKNNL